MPGNRGGKEEPLVLAGAGEKVRLSGLRRGTQGMTTTLLIVSHSVSNRAHLGLVSV